MGSTQNPWMAWAWGANTTTPAYGIRDEPSQTPHRLATFLALCMDTFPSLSLDFLMQSTYRLRREPAGRVDSKFVPVCVCGLFSCRMQKSFCIWVCLRTYLVARRGAFFFSLSSVHCVACGTLPWEERRSSPRSQKFFPGRLTRRDADRSACLPAATLKTKLSPIEILLACLRSKRFVALSPPSFSPLSARPPLCAHGFPLGLNRFFVPPYALSGLLPPSLVNTPPRGKSLDSKAVALELAHSFHHVGFRATQGPG